MENQLRVIVCGDNGSGKSIASRVISKALREAGFLVSLWDKTEVTQEIFDEGLKTLRGTPVDIDCVNVKE